MTIEKNKGRSDWRTSNPTTDHEVFIGSKNRSKDYVKIEKSFIAKFQGIGANINIKVP